MGIRAYVAELMEGLCGALNELGVHATREQAVQVMRRYNTTGSGTLEFSEFKQLVRDLRQYKGE